MIRCYVDQCCVYHGRVDSAEHIFSTYHFAKSYLDLLQSKLGFNYSFMHEWANGDWLREGEQRGRQFSVNTTSVIATFLWFIWKNRNETKFSNRHSQPLTIWFKVHSTLKCNDHQNQTQAPEDNSFLLPLRNRIQALSPLLFFCDGSFTNPKSNAGTGFCL